MNRRDFFYTALGAATAAWTRIAGSEGLLAQAREKAKPLNLRITDLKTFLVDTQSDENFVFVKIYTNQGIVGLGEATMTGKEATVEQAILEHKRYLVGKDPTDIEFLWQAMYRGPRYRGGPVLMSAMSGVEIAQWDILGQALGQPIWKLLGGKARDKVRIYPHAEYPDNKGRTKEDYVRNWLRRKGEGWTACKAGFMSADSNNIIDPRRTVREAIAKLEA